MMTTFLEAAILVLLEKGRPLKAKEIYKIAKERGYLKSKGQTPEMTMNARISTDIRVNLFNSRFMRIGPNKYALRSFGMREFLTQPFKKKLPNEVLTCIKQEALKTIKRNFGFYHSKKQLSEILSLDNLKFINRNDAERDDNYKQLISYVILTNQKNEVLTYRRGIYTSAHDMLRGSLCIGFGGHVQHIDSTNRQRGLFPKHDTNKTKEGYLGGVFETARREIYEELNVGDVAELKLIGYINDDSSFEGVKHFGIVVQGVLPNDFKLNSLGKEKSINDIQFMSKEILWANYFDFEFWSQLLINSLYSSDKLKPQPVIRPNKFNISSKVIVFVGKIATGKTTLCDIAKIKLGFYSVSSSKCLSKLLNYDKPDDSERIVFQGMAENFINNKSGPSQLASEIKNEIDKINGTVLVDGIRHFETLKELRKYFPDLILVYIDTTRNDAFRNFSVRYPGIASIHQFSYLRQHAVEQEIQFMKGDTDVYLFNGGTVNDLENEFLKWYRSNKND